MNKGGGSFTFHLLISFNGANGAQPYANLIIDSAGSLFGTTSSGGAYGHGTVFKVSKTASGYAGTPTTLVNFNGPNGSNPYARLIADGAGDLFGTTQWGGAKNEGTVFEIAKTTSSSTGYAVTPSVLVSFNGTNGGGPSAGLITDPADDLFGTTEFGGRYGYGTVFEIVNTGGKYAVTPTTLANFNRTDGGNPFAGLIADAAEDLFGAAYLGGTNGNGTVFEIVKTGSGYAGTPTTLVNFNSANGRAPVADLVADAAGNLFGTTHHGGAAGFCHDCGTVFKLSGAEIPLSKNWQTANFSADHSSDITLENTNGTVAVWNMSGLKRIASGSPGNPGAGWRAIGAGYFFGSPYADIVFQNLDGRLAIWQINQTRAAAEAVVGNPGASWHAIGTGDFSGDGVSDILLQNTSGAVAIWQMNGFKVVAKASVSNPGTAWRAIAAGDFNGDGYSDILLQNTNGAVAIWEMKGFKIIGSATIGNPGIAWRVIGSGDFNRDGYADILFQNINGAVAIWKMNGLKRIGGGTVGTPAVTWHVVGTGDYNGDGYSDILLQDANGTVEIWEMDGTTLIKRAVVDNPGSAWHAIGE